MLHGSNPAIPPIGCRGAVELDALAVHRHVQERHVILPADHRPQAPDGRVEHQQGRAVPKAPDQAFGGGRHEFAVFAQVGAVGGEEDDGAVKSSTLPFNHADHQVHVILRRTTSKFLHGRARNIHCALPAAPVLFAPFG